MASQTTWNICGIGVLAAIASVGFLGVPESIGKPTQKPAPSMYEVTYTVTGHETLHMPSAPSALVSLVNDRGIKEDYSEVPLPWTKTVLVPRGSDLTLGATNPHDFGVSCDIKVRGANSIERGDHSMCVRTIHLPD